MPRCSLASDALAQDAAHRVKRRLRADLTAHLFALGPAWTSRERVGELTAVLSGGLADVDAYVTSFQPARALAVIVPLLVLGVVLVLDPPTALVLLFTGPIWSCCSGSSADGRGPSPTGDSPRSAISGRSSSTC